MCTASRFAVVVHYNYDALMLRLPHSPTSLACTSRTPHSLYCASNLPLCLDILAFCCNTLPSLLPTRLPGDQVPMQSRWQLRQDTTACDTVTARSGADNQCRSPTAMGYAILAKSPVASSSPPARVLLAHYCPRFQCWRQSRTLHPGVGGSLVLRTLLLVTDSDANPRSRCCAEQASVLTKFARCRHSAVVLPS